MKYVLIPIFRFLYRIFLTIIITMMIIILAIIILVWKFRIININKEYSESEFKVNKIIQPNYKDYCGKSEFSKITAVHKWKTSSHYVWGYKPIN